MKAFLNQIFQNVNPKIFAKYSPFTSLFADCILLYYIKTKMLPRLFQREQIYALLERTNPEVRYLSMQEFESLVEILQSSFILSFTVIIAFNAIMYALAGRGKPFAVKFLYGYTFSTCLLSALELIGSVFSQRIPFSWATLITMFLYLYVYLGMRYFKILPKTKKNRAR